MSKITVNSEQKLLLATIIDTFISPMSIEETEEAVRLHARSPEHERTIREFCARKGTDNGTLDELISKLENPYKIPRYASQQLLLALELLNRSMTSWIITGSTKNLVGATHAERTKILQDMLKSSLELRRVFASSMKSLILLCHYSILPQRKVLGLDLTRRNVNWDAIGYPGPDPRHVKNPEIGQKPYRFSPLRIADLAALASLSATSSLQEVGVDTTDTLVIDADVVIIGSGAGAGVCAEALSNSSRRVFIVDKAHYLHQSELSLLEADAMQDQFEGEGLVTTVDNSLAVLAGSAIGGGTAINWSCCLPTPHYVRKEWAIEHGLQHFVSPKFANDIKRVQNRLSILNDDQIIQNGPNGVLLEGCRRLGYPVRVAPQNTSLGHNCGWCGLGCRSGEKHGSNVSFLVAAEQQGAKLIAGCYAERLILEETSDMEFKNPFGPQRSKVVRGVMATLHEYPDGQHKAIPGSTAKKQKLIFRSPIVIVAGGALNSPLLLRRSGLTNPNIGQNLRLHPVTCVAGVFKDRNIDPFQGNILTTVCDVVENVEGDGYGAKLEVPAMHPAICAFGLPWQGSSSMKRLMLNYRHASVIIVLSRDKGCGSVAEDPETGKPIVNYRLCDKDGRSLAAGVKAAIKVLAAAGANEVATTIYGSAAAGEPCDETCDDPSAQMVEVDPDLREQSPSVERLCSSVSVTGIRPTQCVLFSAHQMGTCRMSDSSLRGVVCPTGETWEVSGLYVCDASVFPTPSGANPMLTVLAIAYHISDGILQRIRFEENRVAEYCISSSSSFIKLTADNTKVEAEAFSIQARSDL